MAIMIKENIFALFVVARLKLLWVSPMTKRDEAVLTVIKYLTTIHTKELITVSF